MASKIFSPSRVIFISVIIAIIIGTALLSLPVSRLQPVPIIDLIFTATSSICVNGLLTVPMESFSTTGHCIIMILIQIGGLGLITLTLFTVSLFVELGLATQVMAGQMLDLENWSGARRILIFIICLTLVCEIVGALLLFQSFREIHPFGTACFYSIFYAISAFCNAGIDISFGHLQHYAHNYVVLGTIALLMFLGGFGFITLKEILRKGNPFNRTPHRRVLSLQTRIILSALFGLTVGITLIIWFLERHNAFAAMSLPTQLLNALFTGISSRSTGFLTVYAEDMQPASLFAIMMHSFIGSAPGSTGSGIKVTTIVIILATINAAIQSESSVNIKGRRIMQDQIYKALAVMGIGILWLIGITFCLLITEVSFSFLEIIFESVCAFTSLGVSLGITGRLSLIGKILIILSMFVGRIGSLTLLIALRKRAERHEFSYPQERVMIS